MLVAVERSIVVMVSAVVVIVVTVLKPDDGVAELVMLEDVESEFVIGLPSVLLVDSEEVGAVLRGGLGVKGG